jgi:energy-coupling factor transporter ATP-binding protein EcfA2
MDILRKAETLAEAYVVLDPDRPLEGDWFDKFYAERPEEASITPLLDELLLDQSDDDKTLFTGHRGSGKTTELARLEAKLGHDHTVVRFNVEDLLNLGDVNYADLLVVLGLQVFQRAQQSGVTLDQEKLDNLLFWYRETILEEDEKRKLKSEVGGELNAVLAKVNVKLSTDAPRRRTVRAQAEANLSDLLERLNQLLAALQAKTGRRTMVIVDGLDKMYNLNQVSDLFVQGANALMQPLCRAVYTVPLALYHTNDFQQVRMSFTRTFSLPNIKTIERDGSSCEEGQTALLDVLNHRLMPGRLSAEAANGLVANCGGLLKELMTLARSAVAVARRKQGDKGTARPDDVEYAARRVRNTYRGSLTQAQYCELWRLARGGPFTNSPVARDLLHNLSLLEFDGGDAWWRVHPIVQPLLEERKDQLDAECQDD